MDVAHGIRVVFVSDSSTSDAHRRGVERREAGKPSPNDASASQQPARPQGDLERSRRRQPLQLSDAIDKSTERVGEFVRHLPEHMATQVASVKATAARMATKESLIDGPLEQARRFADLWWSWGNWGR